MQTYLKTRPAWIQLLLFIGMAFGLFTIITFAGAVALSKMTGISLLEIGDIKNWDAANPNMIFYIRGLMLLQFLGLFLIPSLLFAYFSDPRPAHYLGLKSPHRDLYWILGILAMVVAIPLAEYLGLLNRQMSLGAATQNWMKSREEEATKQIQFMLNVHTTGQLVLNLIFISLFAGIGEELFFRGILQRLFIRALKNPWAGIIVTAFLFSAFHLQFFGFLPRLLLGVVLGAIYWYSGSLWTAMLAHFLYDALIVVIAYYNPQLVANPDKSIIDPGHMLATGLVSAVLTFLVMWQMKKRSSTSYVAIYKDDTPPQDKFSF